MREGLHTFDMLRERYGLMQSGMWMIGENVDEHLDVNNIRF